jgi:hypothetical protein
MPCNHYKKFALGKMDEEAFREHARSCPVCRDLMEKDANLLSLAKSLKRPVHAPLLWGRIERSLDSEARRAEQPRVLRFPRRTYAVLRFAAVLVVVVTLGVMMWTRSQREPSPSKLLAQSALEKVELQERAYLKAIEDLEKMVQPRMSRMDVELALLYRDKLETIDTQIQRCREALDDNPANAHIRRYMLAALQEKTKTLQEIMRT